MFSSCWPTAHFVDGVKRGVSNFPALRTPGDTGMPQTVQFDAYSDVTEP